MTDTSQLLTAYDALSTELMELQHRIITVQHKMRLISEQLHTARLSPPTKQRIVTRHDEGSREHDN